MTRAHDRARVALIVKRSTLERYLDHPNKRMKQLFADNDPTVANIRAAHAEHVATVAEVRAVLADAGARVRTIRSFGRGFDGNGFDLVVTVGGDGTLLHASHNVGTTPVVGVNSSPSYSVGFFCGAHSGTVERALYGALGGSLARVRLTRMLVTVNDVLMSARVLNDALFCHQSPAATSRYILEHEGIVEEQKSSGLWIGPAAGSTAAQRSAGGRVLPLGSRRLQLVVREPYTPDRTPYRLRRIEVEPGHVLRVRSKSREMMLFLDGPHKVVRVGLGDVVAFTQSHEPLTLLGMTARRERVAD